MNNFNLNWNDVCESVRTWVEYNPVPAAILAVLVVCVLLLVVSVFRRKPQQSNDQGLQGVRLSPEAYKLDIDGVTVTLSRKRQGRVVPQLNSGDSLFTAVEKATKANHGLRPEEVADLLEEAGFDFKNLPRKHVHDRIYAVLCNLGSHYFGY